MRVFPTHRAVRRARTRTVVFFFRCIALLMLALATIVAVHHLFGWWRW